MNSKEMRLFTTAVVLFLALGLSYSWDDGSVLLRDVQVLTLYKGRSTAARRSSPVPQLQCVGGSAGCHAFLPEVVQCQNKGWDGVDVQWECKTDMDNAYRFGHIEVSCEGYSHPADAYILKGSCGLEYTLELTEEGRRTRGSQSGFKGFEGLGGFASSFFSGFSGNKHQHQQYNQQSRQSSHPSGSEDSGGLLVVVVLLLLAYGVYKLFLSGNMTQPGQNHAQAGYPGDGHHDSTAGPPPPGFKPDFTATLVPTQTTPVPTQTTPVPTQGTDSTETTLMDISTHGAMLPLVQVEASGQAWEQEGCWDISLVDREGSPTAHTTPVTLTAELQEAPPPPLGHALLQVLEEPREDNSR